MNQNTASARDAQTSDAAAVADPWWLGYLAKYVESVGGSIPAYSMHHHLHQFMHALARKFGVAEEWLRDAREPRWYIQPAEIAPRRCYLPGCEVDSVAMCSFVDALESLTDASSVSKVELDVDGGAAHHDPIAELFNIARERGEDTAELSRIVASHAVASDESDCPTGAEPPASSPPPTYFSPQRRSPRRRSSPKPPRRAASQDATGDIFNAA